MIAYMHTDWNMGTRDDDLVAAIQNRMAETNGLYVELVLGLHHPLHPSVGMAPSVVLADDSHVVAVYRGRGAIEAWLATPVTNGT